ncbi:flap endonuclease Xni [Thalassotalea agarivorans]|uniref:Flap endonuclease Xni n=1 Tax=Thalassotalea agarivorans TaxID=349064 RepID=A0A1I0FFL4_THASX|nr:flap endonuclease Xni [Thalassotalea agarivorans]SET56772.1 protein Xni [Thalassotalea agarivorans]
MSVHLVLIDALNLIRRIHAVEQRHYGQTGTLSDSTIAQIIHNTSTACAKAMEKIVSYHKATHALAVFDSENPCWRYETFPDYKKGRAKMPEYLAKSLNDIQEVFMQKHVDSLISEQDEADDLIATLAVKVALRGQQVTIISTDKIFLSLLSKHIRVYDYFTRRFLDEAHVESKFSVQPQQLIDYWSLTGDNTNKIPGVSGIGGKTAADLINQYGSLKAILKADDLKSSVREKINTHQEQLMMTRKLLCLQTDIPLGFNLKDIRLPLNDGQSMQSTG